MYFFSIVKHTSTTVNCTLLTVRLSSSCTTKGFRMQPWGTVQKIPNNIDFLNSAPWVTYGKLRYHSK